MSFLGIYVTFILPAMIVLVAWGGVKLNERSIRLSKAAEAAAQANRTGAASTAP